MKQFKGIIVQGNIKHAVFNLIFIGIIMLMFCACTASRPASGLSKEGSKWFKNRDWADGLKLENYKGINQQEFYRQYHVNEAWWVKAFAFLKEHDLEKIAVGKYPIDGDNVFASVTEAPAKDFDKTNWEYHSEPAFIDVQYVIKGKEKIGVAPVLSTESKEFAEINKSYAVYYTAQPDTMYIFFPHDAHRPGIKVDGSETVKKIVIKVRAAPGQLRRNMQN